MSNSTNLQSGHVPAKTSALWNEKHVALPGPEFEAFSRTLPDPDRWALWSARLELVAERLKERCSHIPWYQERAKADPDFWRGLAGSAVHAVY